MNGKEALAIIGISVAAGASLGGAGAAHEQQTARTAAITAETCHEAYDASGGEGVIHKKTLDCMEGGWVPHGRFLDTEGLETGYPVELLEGYVEVQQGRADHFDASEPLVGGAFGLLFGFSIAGFVADRPRRREEYYPENEEPETEGPEPEEPRE